MTRARLTGVLGLAAISFVAVSAHADDPASLSFQTTADTPPPPEPPRPSAEEIAQKKIRFSMKVDGGWTYERIFSDPIYGGDVRLAIGAQNGKVAAYGIVDALFGRTDYSLGAHEVKVGGEFELRVLPVLRLGAGAFVSYLAINRATENGVMDGFGFGGFLTGSLDVLKFGPRGDGAFYIGARMSLASYGGNDSTGPLVWGPTGALGVRF